MILEKQPTSKVQVLLKVMIHDNKSVLFYVSIFFKASTTVSWVFLFFPWSRCRVFEKRGGDMRVKLFMDVYPSQKIGFFATDIPSPLIPGFTRYVLNVELIEPALQGEETPKEAAYLVGKVLSFPRREKIRKDEN